MAGSRIYDLEIGSYLEINPTSMTPYQAAITKQFLEKRLTQGRGLISCDKVYYNIAYIDPDSGLPGVCNLHFHYSMVLYTTDKHPERSYFAVIGSTCLGNGASAIVYKVKGKLKWNEVGEVIYISNKSAPTKSGKAVRSKYAVKIEEHAEGWLRERTVSAYELARRNKKLGVTYPRFFRTENVSATVMKRLKDYDFDALLDLRETDPAAFQHRIAQTMRWELWEFLELENKGVIKLSVYERLVYCREILKAYNEQVRDVKIEHRDIKSENIMIDTSDVIPQIIFFDYGAARDAREEDACKLAGSTGYIAPEIYEGKGAYTGKSDLYSLGCVLAQLWKDGSAYIDQDESYQFGYFQAINRQLNFMDGTPESIREILSQMVSRNPKARSSSDEAIAVIEKQLKTLEQSEGFLLSSPPTTPTR